MIPILCVSLLEENIDNFIENFIEKKGIRNSQIYKIKPERTILTIEQLRNITHLFERAGPEKLIIIYKFETATEAAQNTLLKVLEEKSIFAQFILCTSKLESILPTIISRCKIINLNIGNKARASEMHTFTLIEIFKKSLKITKEDAIKICEDLLFFFKYELEFMIKKENIKKATEFARILSEINKTYALISKNNLNPETGVDHIAFILYKSGIIKIK